MDLKSMPETHKSKSKINCSVFGCSSKKNKNPELSFDHFLKAGATKIEFINRFGLKELVDRRKLWEKVLRMGKRVSPSMRICSLHFVEEDYSTIISPEIEPGCRFFKSTSVPSRNLPKSNIEKAKLSPEIKKREIRLETRLKKIKLNEGKKMKRTKKKIKENAARNEEEKTADTVSEEENIVDQILTNENIYQADELQKSNEVKFMVDFGIQTNLTANVVSLGTQTNFIYNFSQFLKTDEQLSTASGIHNFILFNSIVKAVEIAVPHLNKYGTALTIRYMCLMTFIKLKHNLSYSFLCLIFPTVSIRYCSEIICNTLDILSAVLEPFVYFPSVEEISRNMPLCFDKFSSTQIILDCTEIKIQRPKNLCCQIATYSNYKGTNTVKFMTGVTPGGIISYVSKAYGGRASDNAIFEQSKLIEKIEKNASIMVDKGFLIDDVCHDNNIKLIRPPFLKSQKQFCETDAVECADIASARVHVERLNQRLKVFQILGGSMNSCLVPKCEKIMIILSAVINLSNPIFKDNKFNG